MIERAAILMRDGRMISLPRPARHHDLIWYAIRILGYEKPVGGNAIRGFDIQGFEVHMDGERHKQFCYREPARRIAEQNNQLIPRAEDLAELFSEDVWEGRFDRKAWLRNNIWDIVEEDGVPEVGTPVWYFSECVGVFEGKYLGYREFDGEHVFGGKHGSIDATHWMPLTDTKPDQPWVRIYDESSIISE